MLDKQDLPPTAASPFCFSRFYLYNQCFIFTIYSSLASPVTLWKKQHLLNDGQEGVRRKVRVRKSR